MFERFLTTPKCMRVLSWFLNHQEAEYSGAIVGVECGFVDTNDFMAVLSVLEGAEIIVHNKGEEDLMIRFNKDSSICQLLIHLKDEFNDISFRSEQVSPSLAYLNSNMIKNVIDTDFIDKSGAEDLIKYCKDYKNLDISDPTQAEVYKLCSYLEETGEYNEFIENLDKILEKK